MSFASQFRNPNLPGSTPENPIRMKPGDPPLALPSDAQIVLTNVANRNQVEVHETFDEKTGRYHIALLRRA